MYRYIVLLDGLGRGVHIRARLQNLGLDRRLSFGDVDLYADRHTPVHPLASGGAVIGHLFSSESATQVAQADLTAPASEAALAQRLLDEYWGEYLLLQTEGEGGQGTKVMRDPSGGVDCLYSPRNGFVTSDISIATTLGLYRRQVDWDFIGNNLVYPHHKTGRTGLAQLHELLPGHQLSLGPNLSAPEQVWSPWPFVCAPQRHRDRHDAQADVRHAVSTAVKCLAEADQSLLLELSGGLDSSVVAACLRDTCARVACCNLVTPVPGADEKNYASLMADLLGVQLDVRRLGFDRTPLDFQPPTNSVAPSTWFLQHAANELSEAIGNDLGVASYFSGGGGDTVFCFMRTAAPAADAFSECGLKAGLRAVRDLAELHQCTFWRAGRLAIRKLVAPPKPTRKPDHSFLTSALADEKLDAHPWFAAPSGTLAGDRERVFDLAGTQVFRDGLARGAKRHLRMPLLAQPVMEACLRTPSWMWIAGGRNRAVVRDAFRDVLPPGILHRRSKGTFMNYSGAVYRQNKPLLRDYLLKGELEGKGLLDVDALRRFFDQELASRDDRFMRIFDLCAAESWVRHQHQLQA
ncbi:lasso peptide isopeptide bond-forming cyclase [Dyella lutea]|uniref:lasso peptide isopeptide bond-forming cyclase n=1 Tax=Dyella lutea TaxID=2950441 RepID=UPI0025A41119|nr:lasso peptide isopeptide bond-forming cyclase [Dyella lutea]